MTFNKVFTNDMTFEDKTPYVHKLNLIKKYNAYFRIIDTERLLEFLS